MKSSRDSVSVSSAPTAAGFSIVRAVSLDDEARDELAALERAHRLRTPRVLGGPQGPIAMLDGVEVLNAASNDYLGLAQDRRLARTATIVHKHGVGVGASRLIVGNHQEHEFLERQLAEWMRCGGVRLFNSGYAANTGVLSTLLRPGDAVFSDELNHASIIDGSRLSRAEITVYPHGDLTALEAALARSTHPRRIVVSESLFSMDGDLADVAGLAALCTRHGAALILDEAHAVGALGPEGRGLAAAAGVVPDVVIGTFGKAFGTFGAFAATTRAIADLLWNRARPFVFSTGLPVVIASATLAALDIIQSPEGEVLRRKLAGLAARFRAQVPRAGGAPGSAIAPILVGDDREVMAVSARLFEQRVFVHGVRPPTVPPNTARLRVSLSAAMTDAQIDRLAEAIHTALRQESP